MLLIDFKMIVRILNLSEFAEWQKKILFYVKIEHFLNCQEHIHILINLHWMQQTCLFQRSDTIYSTYRTQGTF